MTTCSLLSVCAALVLSLLLAGCTPASRPGPAAAEQALTRPDPQQVAPRSGASVRVGGSFEAAVSGSDGDFRAGPCRINTPLPVGYPPPTPPGAIDLKTYPLVRLAEITGSGGPDSGMNRAFWPLFNHIKRHDIAMTSPVEMNYRGMEVSGPPNPESWTMAFLYRRPELHQTGVEGPVVVRDAEPVTVVSVGLKGNYSMSFVESGMRQIEDWLAANPQWKPAGSWRSLYYNGPSLFWWNKWAEVQLPVRPSPPQRTARDASTSAGAS